MTDKDDFQDGFVFALNILSSMAHHPVFDDLVAQLVDVATGDITLMPLPPLTLIRGRAWPRRPTDSEHRDFACLILQMAGI
jgi:hypothetical protein